MGRCAVAEHESLFLDVLPDLPQSDLLRQLATSLWQVKGVVALWLGGSLATGAADRYSDVDVYLAVDPEARRDWMEPDLDAFFQGECLARRFSQFGENLYVHHLLLAGGEVYDLHVQPADAQFFPETRLILGCRDPALRVRLEQGGEGHEFWPASVIPFVVEELIEIYWHEAHKHRKVLYRGLDLVLVNNLRLTQGWFLRLAYIQATGQDCGDLRRSTIHSLTPVSRAIQEAPSGVEVVRVVGAPTRTRAELVAALDALHAQMARLGRELARTYEFEYPEQLEAVVLGSWEAFKTEHRL
jgi:hypothetical protein